jgi:hypothetical protein
MPLFAIGKLSRKTLQELGAFIPNKLLFVSSPSVGVEHFGWIKNMLLCTLSVGAVDICGVYMILILRA